MWDIRNLKGTIQWEDELICSFEIENGIVSSFEDFHAKCRVPFWFKLYGINKETIYSFVSDRLPEPNRYGLEEECRKAGIDCTAEAIIKYNNGNGINDKYWIRYETGPQTWHALRKKIGDIHN